MQLNVVLLNSLIKAINHTYDILIIRVEFDMLLLAIRSVSFWGVLGLDLLHKRNRVFCFLVCLYNTLPVLSLILYFFFYLIASLFSFVFVYYFFCFFLCRSCFSSASPKEQFFLFSSLTLQYVHCIVTLSIFLF